MPPTQREAEVQASRHRLTLSNPPETTTEADRQETEKTSNWRTPAEEDAYEEQQDASEEDERCHGRR